MRYWWRTQKSWRCRTASRCCGCKRRKMENSKFSWAVKCATIKGSFEVTRWRTMKQMRWFNFEFFWHELTFSKKSWLKSLILSAIMFYIRCQTFQWVGSARKNTNLFGSFCVFFQKYNLEFWADRRDLKRNKIPCSAKKSKHFNSLFFCN